jgi:hypothetical protein
MGRDPSRGEALNLCTIYTFREHSGNIRGIFREHAGNMQGIFREHAGNMQVTFRDHSGNIQGTFREHSGSISVVVRPPNVTVDECGVSSLLITHVSEGHWDPIKKMTWPGGWCSIGFRV